MLRSQAFATQQLAQGEDEIKSDLLEAVGISQRLYHHAVTRVPGNYLMGVLGDTQLYKGNGLELAPLTGIFASHVKPDFRHFSAVALQAFQLQPGTSTLQETDRGTPVALNDLTGPMPAAVAQAPAAADAARQKKEKKVKKDKKEKKERKEKKRKRSPSQS